MSSKALTDKEIRAAKVRYNEAGKPIKYDLVDSTRERGVGRLIVRVSMTGAKKFNYRWKENGKTSFLQIGQYPSLSLSQARDAIKPFQVNLLAGKNPKIEQDREISEFKRKQVEDSKKGSLEELFQGYTNKMKKDGKSTYDRVLKSLEKETYPFLHKSTKARDVEVDDLVDVLSEMIERGAGVQSNRVRSYLHAAFNFGLKQDHDPANKKRSLRFGLIQNPVSSIPKQSGLEKPGTNYLPIERIAELTNTFSHTPKVGFLTTSLLKLCFYTGGQRPHELARLTWDSIDWENATITMQASETKNRKVHVVPLGELALDLLRDVKRKAKSSAYVFPHSKDKTTHMVFSSISKAVSRFRLHFTEFPHFIPRDIRRTCKTNMLSLGIPKTDLDRLNNHAAQDVSSKHYDMYEYLKEKREAINIWDSKLKELFDSYSSQNLAKSVVPFLIDCKLSEQERLSILNFDSLAEMEEFETSLHFSQATNENLTKRIQILSEIENNLHRAFYNEANIYGYLHFKNGNAPFFGKKPIELATESFKGLIATSDAIATLAHELK
jgi:integrase